MIESAGARLAAWKTGPESAPTVILVHGYPDTHAVWDDVVPLLASRFHVVTFDLRGMGESVAPEGPGAFRLTALSGDLRAVAAAVSPGRPVHVVGHDWGAFVVWEALAEAARGVGPAPPAPPAPPIASFTAIAGPRIQAAPHWVASRLRRHRPADLAALAGQARRSWYVAAIQLPVLPELVIGRAARRTRSESPTLARDAVTGLALYRENRSPAGRPTPVAVPVQLIVPTRDSFISRPFYADAKDWATNLWRRDIRAGHWVQRSHPAPVARAIGELVDHVEGASEAPGLRRARHTPNPRPLHGRLAVVTGAGSGIGRATARALAREGAEVVCADIDLLAARDTVATAAGTLTAVQIDVSDLAAMEQFAAAVHAAQGVPDIVVNNAGVAVSGPFHQTGPEDWERVLGVNLWGVIHGARLFGTMMVRAGVEGQIINLASAAAYAPSRTLSAYSTTKAAVLMLSECLRAELAERGIGVTAICPGFINTNIPRATHFVGVDAVREAQLRRRAADAFSRRAASPDRVAAAIVGAVHTNPAVLTVTLEAKVLLALSRIAPPALRRLARVEAG